MSSTEFNATQIADVYPEGIEFGFWSLARHRIISYALRCATKDGLRSQTGRVLEIGCGPGIVVNALRAEGYDVWGVELGTPIVRKVALPYVTTGVQAQDLDLAFRASFETVLLFDVVEHIGDEVTFLNEILATFPNCRCVLITVPARQEVWSNYDEYNGHFRHYTRRTLDTALVAAGLIPHRTRYFFRTLYIAAWLINILGCKRTVVLSPPRFLLLERFVAFCFGLEDRLVGGLPVPGLSLISIARRS